MKIKKDDEVKVIRGKDKGKTGKVERIFPKENKVLVTGVNQYKKHQKARAQNQQSEIITITKPLPISNILFLCPKCHETARIGYSFEKDKKVRICKKCEAVV